MAERNWISSGTPASAPGVGFCAMPRPGVQGRDNERTCGVQGIIPCPPEANLSFVLIFPCLALLPVSTPSQLYSVHSSGVHALLLLPLSRTSACPLQLDFRSPFAAIEQIRQMSARSYPPARKCSHRLF